MFRQYAELPRAVHILCLGTFVNRAGSFFLVFLTIYIGEKLSLGPRFATFCVGVFGLGSLFGSLLGGQLADQIGRRNVMLASLMGGAVILAAFPHVTIPALLVATIFLYAITIDMYRPAASAMISDVTRPEQRPAAFGLMYLAINLGFACGATVGGLLAKHSFVLLFTGDAITTFAYSLIIFFLVTESRPVVRTSGDVKNASPQHQSGVPAAVALRHILHDWPFLLFCTGCLLGGIVFMQDMSTLPLYMKSLGHGADKYGFVISLNGMMIVLLQVPLTIFFARFDRFGMIAAGAVVVGTGIGMCAFARTVPHFAGTVVIFTLGELMQAPFTQTVVAEMAPLQMRARYMGVFTMCYSSAMMFGAPIGGFVLDRYGGTTLWTGAFIGGIVSAGFLLLARQVLIAQKSRPDWNHKFASACE